MPSLDSLAIHITLKRAAWAKAVQALFLFAVRATSWLRLKPLCLALVDHAKDFFVVGWWTRCGEGPWQYARLRKELLDTAR